MVDWLPRMAKQQATVQLLADADAYVLVDGGSIRQMVELLAKGYETHDVFRKLVGALSKSARTHTRLEGDTISPELVARHVVERALWPDSAKRLPWIPVAGTQDTRSMFAERKDITFGTCLSPSNLTHRCLLGTHRRHPAEGGRPPPGGDVGHEGSRAHRAEHIARVVQPRRLRRSDQCAGAAARKRAG